MSKLARAAADACASWPSSPTSLAPRASFVTAASRPSRPRALPLEPRRIGRARLYDDTLSTNSPRSWGVRRALNRDCTDRQQSDRVRRRGSGGVERFPGAAASCSSPEKHLRRRGDHWVPRDAPRSGTRLKLGPRRSTTAASCSECVSPAIGRSYRSFRCALSVPSVSASMYSRIAG
jgi:hypothetical protein